MKKTKWFMPLLLGVIMATGICACGGDSDDDIKSGKTEGTYRGHEYVDLGLPSGLKWATCNVGAGQPGDFGDYFVCGSIVPLTVESTIPEDLIDELPDDMIGTDKDVAHYLWGGNWRMPKESEAKELIENCKWTWTTNTVTGKYGYYVVGPNGNRLFLPAAGRMACFDNSQDPKGYKYELTSHNKKGCYWNCLEFDSSNKRPYSYGYNRSVCSGYSVRPVCP